MPHDQNNIPLSVGDRVILHGTIEAITSDQPNYCNILMKADIGMAPDSPDYSLSLSARQVELFWPAKFEEARLLGLVPPDTFVQKAQAAYHRYYESFGTHDPYSLDFEALPDDERNAWIAAANV